MPTPKRPGRKSQKPSPPRRRTAKKRSGAGRAVRVTSPGPLQYKVVELSTVDEGALERTLNEWTAKGWNLDGIQFAMRESSKRPAMAFILFTREGDAAAHDEDAARGRLLRMSETGSPTAALAAEHAREHAEWAAPRISPLSAHERLARLAGLDEPEPREEGLTLEPEE
ncbi:hypothetical protein MYMAC_004022 [Corallococcus macrosporus DSM 14697]|uniref:DUF4177 domain-containing protein n=1 Tax=Corallococcus macrosporus DSM 14697 TaxID=1189310 RepID=A0A250JX18_9BACT|nr:hypothetical protein MYMAC_004022 [Corallococcus macrosporus DSM 14697]